MCSRHNSESVNSSKAMFPTVQVTCPEPHAETIKFNIVCFYTSNLHSCVPLPPRPELLWHRPWRSNLDQGRDAVSSFS